LAEDQKFSIEEKKNLKKRGSKEKLNYEVILDQIERLGAMQLELKQIAWIWGVTPITISRYLRVHPELLKSYNQGRERMVKRLIAKALQLALEEDDRDMLKFCLKNLTNWTDRPVVEVNNYESKELNVTNVTNIGNASTPELRDRLITEAEQRLQRIRELANRRNLPK
jgi:hypothetical protein